MVRVAAAQVKVTEDIDANLQRILKFIDDAKSKKVDIVCFPECCLNTVAENKADVSKQIEEIRAKCKERQIWCIFGSYVSESGKTTNSVFLIDRSGRIKYKYDKVHLWISEKKNVVPGVSNNVIDTEFCKIGIIDCWDFAFPSYVQQLSKSGAKIIFCPNYLVDSEEDQEAMRTIPLVRAFENIAFFVSCDAFAGDTLSESYICHPLKVMKSIVRKEGMIITDLNLEEVDSLRKYYDHLG